MDVSEIDPPSEREWEQLVDGEPNPWGTAGEGLEWAAKEIYVGLRDEAGRLLATAGLLCASVRVGEAAELDVVGLGGVFVTRSMRGRGLLATLVGASLDIARGLAPEHAMLFCRTQLAPVYTRYGFELVPAPVLARQPSGEVVVPMEAMHLGLVPGAAWPEGDVHLLGLPF